MAEVIGISASIIQIAGAGASLSKALYNYVGSATCADQQISDIACDVEITANTLDSVSEVFRSESSAPVFSKKAINDANSLIKRCESVFAEIYSVIDKRRKSTKEGNKSISALGKLSWPLKEQKIQLLQSRLQSLKSSLILLLNVLQLANVQSRGQIEKNALKQQRSTIRQLHQHQQESLTALQALEKKLGRASLDEEDTLYGSGSMVVTRVPTINMTLQSCALEYQEPTQKQEKAATIPGAAESSPDELEISDSDPAISDYEEEHLTAEDLSKCANQVRKLLERLSALQKSLESPQSASRPCRKSVHKIYRQFCRKFESDLVIHRAQHTASNRQTRTQQNLASLSTGTSNPTNQSTSGPQLDQLVQAPSLTLDEDDVDCISMDLNLYEGNSLDNFDFDSFLCKPDDDQHYLKSPRSSHLNTLNFASTSPEPLSPTLPTPLISILHKSTIEYLASNATHPQSLARPRQGLGDHMLDTPRHLNSSPLLEAIPRAHEIMLNSFDMKDGINEVDNPSPDYTEKVFKPELARRQMDATERGVPPTEEEAQEELLRDYQLSRLVLVCGNQRKRKLMYRIVDHDEPGSTMVLETASGQNGTISTELKQQPEKFSFGNPVEEPPLFVNPKQFNRIVKRRIERQALEQRLQNVEGSRKREEAAWVENPEPAIQDRESETWDFEESVSEDRPSLCDSASIDGLTGKQTEKNCQRGLFGKHMNRDDNHVGIQFSSTGLNMDDNMFGKSPSAASSHTVEPNSEHEFLKNNLHVSGGQEMEEAMLAKDELPGTRKETNNGKRKWTPEPRSPNWEQVKPHTISDSGVQSLGNRDHRSAGEATGMTSPRGFFQDQDRHKEDLRHGRIPSPSPRNRPQPQLLKRSHRTEDTRDDCKEDVIHKRRKGTMEESDERGVEYEEDIVDILLGQWTTLPVSVRSGN